ncbi:hypothetical protein RRG08_045929 [Elysia crispata]|uniref:Uncharacterized protein n=1 Tax=Elysia crispata TaxID=231223 RepID=A0AAE1ARG1_9GAST|nr:hypothetical protein RRG08_045929 [Elysia crispata]
MSQLSPRLLVSDLLDQKLTGRPCAVPGLTLPHPASPCLTPPHPASPSLTPPHPALRESHALHAASRIPQTVVWYRPVTESERRRVTRLQHSVDHSHSLSSKIWLSLWLCVNYRRRK